MCSKKLTLFYLIFFCGICNGYFLLFGLDLIVVCRGKDNNLVATGMAEDRDEKYKVKRERMVKVQLQGRDINDPQVLESMLQVPRHLFVPDSQMSRAYDDHPIPIGEGQTISQPYIVALMTQLARPRKSHKILEVGTGSGYQSAVISMLVDRVYSIESVVNLAEKSSQILTELAYDNVQVRNGNGCQGWPEESPFDCILVTAAPKQVPPLLLDQLAIGGRLVIPVGSESWNQTLLVIKRTKKGFQRRKVIPVRFVPMTGEDQDHGVP